MIMATAETLIGTRKLSENRPASEKKRPAGDRAPECLPTLASPNLTESIQSLREERDTVRAAHAKLQQAIYEAAQVQRRLCAPPRPDSSRGLPSCRPMRSARSRPAFPTARSSRRMNVAPRPI